MQGRTQQNHTANTRTEHVPSCFFFSWHQLCHNYLKIMCSPVRHRNTDISIWSIYSTRRFPRIYEIELRYIIIIYFSIDTGQHLKQECALLNWQPINILLNIWGTNALSKLYWKKWELSFAPATENDIIYSRKVWLRPKRYLWKYISTVLLLNFGQSLLIPNSTNN